MTKSIEETLCIAINDGVNADSSLYRLKRGTILRIIPGSSLLGKHVALYCNYPITEKAEFIRKQYVHLNWFNKFGHKLTDGSQPYIQITDLDVFCEIEMNRAGPFHFYFIYQNCSPDLHQGSLYVQVEPILTVGQSKLVRKIPLDSIRCQTVMSKCLGPLSTWESKLIVAKNAEYNMLHFTPVQELGGSRSGYSLKDQLKVNPEFCDSKSNSLLTNKKGAAAPFVSFDELGKVVKKMKHDWGIASICDIVLNHTANESEWIQQHPECSYSCHTMPHLRPAFLLDALLAQVTNDTAAELLEHVGVPKLVQYEEHLQALRHQLHAVYLPKINICEFYQCNITAYVKQFNDILRNRTPTKETAKSTLINLTLLQDPEYHRLGCKIDFDAAIVKYNVYRSDCFDEDTRRRKCAESFRTKLEQLNDDIEREVQGYLFNAVENCLAGIRYERVQADGPKVKEISLKYPLFSRYFTNGNFNINTSSLTDIEAAMYESVGKLFMAHNGWVMNADPLSDFARPQSGIANVYLKRELIAWGDSIKLRFGDTPEDCPYLWHHIRQYVEMTAKIFDGVRLDNCHSTPLHVAEYMLDCARKVNPELYVVAELFTNSDQTDNIFVNRLGITSLIREAQSAWDSHEEGRLVYRYGGAPVGAFYSSPKRALAPTIAHALFLDLTHDNPSPVEKRSVFDLLPTAALVSMACCATGSNRGYDELVPHHIHVVNEERQYQEWNRGVDTKSGIIAARRALNLLHGKLAEEGFDQVYVDQMNPNVVAVTRHCPKTHQSVILVAHTSFAYPEPNAGPTSIRPLRFEGSLEEIILEAEIVHKYDNSSGRPFDRPYNFEKDSKYINGLTEYELKINEHIPLTQSTIFRKQSTNDGHITQLDFENLRPGCVVAVRVALHKSVQTHIATLKPLLDAFHNESGAKYQELKDIASKLNLLDLNATIYRCDQEERDMGKGFGAYDIPNYGPLVYCGSQGFASILADIAPNNDLGHPFCSNLRDGNWMIDYMHERLQQQYPGAQLLANWLRENLVSLKEIPRYLVPSYFDVIVTGVHNVLVNRCVELMPNFIANGDPFTKVLALGSVQFMAVSQSADLPKLSPNTAAPKPPERCSTLSAGLPHFSTGYMRCWGRDTFIALRGLLLLTGRFDEARYIILSFGSCLRHGLIPNLLDNGTKPRFNCRDAVWWWMYSIRQYVNEAPNGIKLLVEPVSRIFPTDDASAQPAGKCDQPLYEVMQEALTIHFQGLVYRERNAGHEIDEHMTEKGFNNQIGINPDTGFVFGGNDANCGTWMDKMGSSQKAGNKGRPTTPRDGSAVELIGLQMAVLRFMQQMSEKHVIPYNSVERNCNHPAESTKTIWTYEHWADLIAENFDRQFYVNHEPGQKYANKMGIYKDSVGASQPWADYQLRCNFPVAMCAAPELFNPKHAWEALEHAKKSILGPLGMKTLDPDDWAYRGFYDNSNDSDDPLVAHGANYHQGPEWIWPIGFYLRARLIFAKKNGCLQETIEETWSILSVHLKEIQTSHWRGLAELTNENGSYCIHSCRTQAWSMATVLEVLNDLRQFSTASK